MKHIATHNLKILDLLPVLFQPNVLSLSNHPSHIVPRLKFKALPDCHYLLVTLLRHFLGYVNNRGVMLIHVLNAFVIFEVPNLHIAFRHSYQDVLVRDRVDLCYSV